MKILALETATEYCSVALLDEQGVHERFEHRPREQTARVLPMVEELLADRGTSLSALDAVAFSQGPGAFTGVRIAASVAQGLAHASGLPVIGVSTLASVALAAADVAGTGHWLVALDARMGQVYSGLYSVGEDDRVEALSADGLYDPDAVPVPEGVRAAGDGNHYAALADRLGNDCWQPDVAPRAATVARLARHKWQRGETLSARDAQPVYLRDKVIQGAVR